MENREAVLVCGEHDNSSESTGTVVMNHTGGCKTATVVPYDSPSGPEKEFEHRVAQRAHFVDAFGCHIMTTKGYVRHGLSTPGKLDLAQDKTGSRSCADHCPTHSVWLVIGLSPSELRCMYRHAPTNVS